MKRPSFDLLTGILIVAILLLALLAGWLIVSIADQELTKNSTPIPWVTATFRPESVGGAAGPTQVQGQAASPFTSTPSPTSTPLPPPALPAGHPTAGPQPQTCDECHQNMHGGGG